ncbi:hypothetical protein KVO79_24705 [Serratia quinivorans]|uniref:hypothetical protein n=1 Tax=Serratia quinivorans TaxID=137545 RepID=UPI001C4419E3|nr:hypothetical protein [Serratia quinivorans]MBV6695298.1 hypothetical protein [Serratia quinivorans]
MTYLLGALVLFIGITYLAWKLTNQLYWKLYKMADQRGCAARFESIVRQNNYTQPRELHWAYQEAIH